MTSEKSVKNYIIYDSNGISKLKGKNLITQSENAKICPKLLKIENLPKFFEKLTEHRHVIYQNDPYDVLNTTQMKKTAQK